VPLAAELRQRAGDDGHLGAYHLLLPSLVYYVGRPIEELGSVDQAAAFFAPGRRAWVITSDVRHAELSAASPGLCVVARHPLFEAKLSDLVAGQPADDVVLVTNVCGRDSAAVTERSVMAGLRN
jgi:hypothetical protein